MKKNCVVVLLCIGFFVTIANTWCPAQSQRTIKTKMDSVMARSVEVFNTAWEATKAQDFATMKPLMDSGQIIMVSRGTICTFVRDHGDNWVVITVKGREGEWVTMRQTFRGFE